MRRDVWNLALLPRSATASTEEVSVGRSDQVRMHQRTRRCGLDFSLHSYLHGCSPGRRQEIYKLKELGKKASHSDRKVCGGWQLELNKMKWERESQGPHQAHFWGLGSILQAVKDMLWVKKWHGILKEIGAQVRYKMPWGEKSPWLEQLANIPFAGEELMFLEHQQCSFLIYCPLWASFSVYHSSPQLISSQLWSLKPGIEGTETQWASVNQG